MSFALKSVSPITGFLRTQHHIVCWKSDDVSDEHIASTYGVGEEPNKKTKWKQVASRDAFLTTSYHVGVLFGLFFENEYGDDIILRNVGWLSTDYTALYPFIITSVVTSNSTEDFTVIRYSAFNSGLQGNNRFRFLGNLRGHGKSFKRAFCNLIK
jgi:hypothetical protein